MVVVGIVFAAFSGFLTPGHPDSLESDRTRHRDESVCLRGGQLRLDPCRENPEPENDRSQRTC